MFCSVSLIAPPRYATVWRARHGTARGPGHASPHGALTMAARLRRKRLSARTECACTEGFSGPPSGREVAQRRLERKEAGDGRRRLLHEVPGQAGIRGTGRDPQERAAGYPGHVLGLRHEVDEDPRNGCGKGSRLVGACVRPGHTRTSRSWRTSHAASSARKQLLGSDQCRTRGDIPVAGREVRHRRLFEDLLNGLCNIGPETLQPTP